MTRAIELSVDGRNDAGFWLACQLRDERLTRGEAGSVMLLYQGSVDDLNTKGHVEEYTVDEAMASRDQAFDRPPRDPSGAITFPCDGQEVDRPDGHDAENEQRIRVSAWPDPPAPEAFYGLAGDLVRTLGPHTEADPAALLSSFFVAFGNVIGRSAHFVAEADLHYMNLFLVQVGISSKGRKGVSFGHIKQILGELDNDWKSFHIQSGLSSGEGILWAVRDPIEKQEPIRESGQITGYQSVVTDPGVIDKRLLLMEGEFASVLRVLGREGNTLSAMVRTAWDTGDLTSLTKNSPARATGAHISIIGHITRSELLRYLDSTEAGSGFGNRFLWAWVRRSKCLPEGGRPDESKLRSITDRLRECITVARATGRMERDQEARALWHEVYPELSEGKPGLLGAMIARAEAQVMRLACLYALLDRSGVVRIEHLKAALALWSYCEGSARYIFGDSMGDPIADEIIRMLRQTAEGLTRWDISNHFGRNKPASAIARALGALVELGLVRSEGESTGGRPSERWFAAAPLPAQPNEENEVDEETAGEITKSSCLATATGEGADDDGDWLRI